MNCEENCEWSHYEENGEKAYERSCKALILYILCLNGFHLHLTTCEHVSIQPSQTFKSYRSLCIGHWSVCVLCHFQVLGNQWEYELLVDHKGSYPLCLSGNCFFEYFLSYIPLSMQIQLYFVCLYTNKIWFLKNCPWVAVAVIDSCDIQYMYVLVRSIILVWVYSFSIWLSKGEFPDIH